MNWIKLDTCTPDKPEVHKLSELLGIDPDEVLGKLVRLWAWADSQTTDGNATSVTKTLLDRITHRKGFADALLSVDWLRQTEFGFSIPNFDRHNGDTAKSRGLTAKRVSKLRDARNANVTQDVTVEALPEKIREDKNREEEVRKEKNIEKVGKDTQATDVAECDSDLLEWIKFWNSLKSKNLVAVGASTKPSKGILHGWKRVANSNELQTLLCDRNALEAKIRDSSFLHEATWFSLPKLFGGKNSDGEYIAQKLMDGGYVSSGSSKLRSANVGAGVTFDPARSTINVVF